MAVARRRRGRRWVAVVRPRARRRRNWEPAENSPSSMARSLDVAHPTSPVALSAAHPRPTEIATADLVRRTGASIRVSTPGTAETVSWRALARRPAPPARRAANRVSGTSARWASWIATARVYATPSSSGLEASKEIRASGKTRADATASNTCSSASSAQRRLLNSAVAGCNRRARVDRRKGPKLLASCPVPTTPWCDESTPATGGAGGGAGQGGAG